MLWKQTDWGTLSAANRVPFNFLNGTLKRLKTTDTNEFFIRALNKFSLFPKTLRYQDYVYIISDGNASAGKFSM